jgi:hypothetical protein
MTTESQNTPTPKHWTTHPTKKQLMGYVIVWLIASTLQILVITDLFTESLFQKKHISGYFMIILSAMVVLNVVRNYFRTNK